ncbi:deleted in malignant brain tumors 1 protein-like [Heptranchias perlo]|uniref:deleted in malignant brain tumors 1 protein-like n=1 Tax=Heptranchias perlo TaxID=212740 RepID=UPI00355A4FCC
MITEMIINEMTIGAMMISEMMISEMMINEMIIGEMMIDTVKLRLVNGGSPCSGRVEIHYRGQWGTVWDSLWDLPDAAVVCRELGCRAALSAPGGAHFGEGSGPIVTWNVRCGGTEAALRDCESVQWGHIDVSHSRDAGVICSGSSKPRLVNGDSPCAGRLEINWSGTWRTVCGDRSWDLQNAEAVCEELGCGSGIAAPLDAHFGEGSGPVIGSPGCGHKRDVGVICSGAGSVILELELRIPELEHQLASLHCIREVENYVDSTFQEVVTPQLKRVELRLVSGSSRCSGRVEVLHGDQWGTVCDIYFGLEDASVVCEHLQCGAVITTPGGAHFGEGTGPVWKENYKCRGNESRLWDCPVSSWEQFNCSHGNDASVICSDEGWLPRLTNGGSRCDGRVEIYYNGSWGRVRDNHWDLNDANVVCRQLGCGCAISAYNSSKYGEGDGPVRVNDVQCDGNESQLRNCSLFTLNQSLTDSEDVGVLCSEHKQIRLVDGGSPCAGRVEIYYNGTWGSVCDDSWDLLDTDVVCMQLGCGYSVKATAPVSCGQTSGPIWLDELRCTGNESVLWECDSSAWGDHDCIHKEDVRIVCSEHKEIRLVKGDHSCEGRVEVFYRGSWGTVCYDDWDMKDGEVVCKQLDCGSVTEIPFEAHFGEGTGPIWLDNVECRSDESFLWQCSSTPWAQHNCKHSEDAGVVCSGNQSLTRSDSFHSCTGTPDHTSDQLPGQQLRLVGGRTNCSGRVEIMFNNTWGTVCDDSWDRREARVVCRQLDCGSALADSGEPVFGKGEGPVWLNRVQCKGSELFLWDCRSSTWAQRVCAHKVASVMCSGRSRNMFIQSMDAFIYSFPCII